MTRRVVMSVYGLGVLAVVHAGLTWSIEATAVLFGGGAVIAFGAEVLATTCGWVDHQIDPRWLGVPVYVVVGWPTIVYIAYRVTLVVVDGWVAVLGAALVATAFDFLTDHRGVENGYWQYPDRSPGPRIRGVPWWNFLGWAVITVATTGLTYLVV